MAPNQQPKNLEQKGFLKILAVVCLLGTGIFVYLYTTSSDKKNTSQTGSTGGLIGTGIALVNTQSGMSREKARELEIQTLETQLKKYIPTEPKLTGGNIRLLPKAAIENLPADIQKNIASAEPVYDTYGLLDAPVMKDGVPTERGVATLKLIQNLNTQLQNSNENTGTSAEKVALYLKIFAAGGGDDYFEYSHEQSIYEEFVKKDYASAILFEQKALGQLPKDSKEKNMQFLKADYYSRLAWLYLRNGKVSEAKSTATFILRTHPENILARYVLFEAYWINKETEKAKELLSEIRLPIFNSTQFSQSFKGHFKKVLEEMQ